LSQNINELPGDQEEVPRRRHIMRSQPTTTIPSSSPALSTSKGTNLTQSNPPKKFVTRRPRMLTRKSSDIQDENVLDVKEKKYSTNPFRVPRLVNSKPCKVISFYIFYFPVYLLNILGVFFSFPFVL
jgi:hypothetical protein